MSGERAPNFDSFGTIFKRHTWGFEVVSDGSDPDVTFAFSFSNEVYGTSKESHLRDGTRSYRAMTREAMAVRGEV